jgi:hypothetical protein
MVTKKPKRITPPTTYSRRLIQVRRQGALLMVHPYEVRQYRAEERLPERHVLHERTEHERTAAREGRHRVEEHRDHRSR